MLAAFILFFASLFTVSKQNRIFNLKGLLCGYHAYLISTNQTTWEFARKTTISYLRIYPNGFRPFDKGIIENIKMSFFHKGQLRLINLNLVYSAREWELPSPTNLRK